MITDLTKTKSYVDFLKGLKEKILTSRVKAALSVNAQMVLLYWEIGNEILLRQKSEGWGARIIERLSTDLRKSFPEMKGLSSRNLKYMRKFAEVYPDSEFVQQVAAQIPWFHNCILIDKVKGAGKREWYIQQTIQNGWSRSVLVHQIETDLYNRQSGLTHNFDRTLLAPQSDLAKETLKDPYIFDFLTVGEEAHERDLENQLVQNITKFLLELGVGFTYVGRQYNIEVGGLDYFIDLLFYHLKLRCFVAIELKVGEFKPEYAGKINFYLSALDDLVKTEQDNPSIGIILCKTRKKIVAEYTLRDMSKPIGVSEYKLTEAIPEELKSSLPTIEELEAGLIEDL